MSYVTATNALSPKSIAFVREKTRFLCSYQTHKIWDIVNACYVMSGPFLTSNAMEEECRKRNELHQHNWWVHGRPGLNEKGTRNG